MNKPDKKPPLDHLHDNITGILDFARDYGDDGVYRGLCSRIASEATGRIWEHDLEARLHVAHLALTGMKLTPPKS